MAEGWTRALRGELIDPYSAGVAAKGLDQRAVRAMNEAGVDISSHQSKNVEELGDITFDVVVTVCDNVRESCPVFSGTTRGVHVGFDDPPYLAREARTDEEALVHYRRVRDEIKAFVETLPDSLKQIDEE
jgi:arsenate reductase